MSGAIRVVVGLALSVLGYLATGFAAALLPVAYLAAVTPWLVLIDHREHRLPNALVVPAIAAGLVACAAQWLTATPPATPLIAGAAYAAFLLVLNLTGGMGMGDVKLGGALGLAAWTPAVAVVGPMAAFLAGGVVALALLLGGQRGRQIAFGPYLLGGFWLAVGLVGLARLI